MLDRLDQHLRDYNVDKEKYHWNSAVVFTGRDLNKALIRYLENCFVFSYLGSIPYSNLAISTLSKCSTNNSL